MEIMGARSLAWVLRLVTDVAIVAWLILTADVLAVMVQQRTGDGGGGRQASVYVEVALPPEIAEPVSPAVTVFNAETSGMRIHYRTSEGRSSLDVARSLGRVIVMFSFLPLILWNLRQILTSLVARQPLTLANVRRFQFISLLMAAHVVRTALSRSFQYERVAALFRLIPPRGLPSLLGEHVDWPRLFSALLVLLLAEILRLGAEHRADSEAVV